MRLVRIGAPGHERPAVIAADDIAYDLGDRMTDVDGGFFAAGGLADPGALELWLDVNDEPTQRGTTATMVFDVATIIHYVSQFMILQPGDLICTGTPPGVGMGQHPPRYLHPGDTMRLGITGLGEQRQRVVPAPRTRSASPIQRSGTCESSAELRRPRSPSSPCQRLRRAAIPPTTARRSPSPTVTPTRRLPR